MNAVQLAMKACYSALMSVGGISVTDITCEEYVSCETCGASVANLLLTKHKDRHMYKCRYKLATSCCTLCQLSEGRLISLQDP